MKRIRVKFWQRPVQPILIFFLSIFWLVPWISLFTPPPLIIFSVLSKSFLFYFRFLAKNESGNFTFKIIFFLVNQGSWIFYLLILFLKKKEQNMIIWNMIIYLKAEIRIKWEYKTKKNKQTNVQMEARSGAFCNLVRVPLKIPILKSRSVLL